MKSLDPAKSLILVVDDIPQNLQVIGRMLERSGYRTTFAMNGLEALRQVKAEMPDLVLLDLMMPDMNGLQVCECLHAEELTCEIPIIFLTADRDSNQLLQAFDRGAVDYITKPFNPPELFARIRTHLELKHTRDELKRALKELEKLATTDPLTGLFNRRQFFQMADREVQLACRYRRSFSVLMLDVDRFKNLNDTYGHAFGDRALQAIAKSIQSALRQTDVLGRVGGEEFAALLPETDMCGALEVAERVRCTVETLSLGDDRQQIRTTISVGASSCQAAEDCASVLSGERQIATIGTTPTSCRTAGESLELLLKQADRALYKAKQEGRNRVIVAAEVLLTASQEKLEEFEEFEEIA